MNQSAFWDGVAASKRFSHPFDLRRFAALVDRGAAILDYGCGYGRVCGALADAGFQRVQGVDPSPAMIARARREHPALRFDVLQGGRLPHAGASFDAVVLFSVLTCLVDDAGQRAVVSEIARVLGPGGVLYVSDILLQDDERNRARYDAAARSRSGVAYGAFELAPGVWFRHLGPEWIADLFRTFERLDYVELPIVTMNGHAARGFQYFGRRDAGSRPVQPPVPERSPTARLR